MLILLYVGFIVAFHGWYELQPIGKNRTRLLLRDRAKNTGATERYIWGYGLGPISTYMSTGMVQGIKERAERKPS